VEGGYRDHRADERHGFEGTNEGVSEAAARDRRHRRGSKRPAISASTWARPQASARPTRCSVRHSAGGAGAPDVVIGFVETYGRPLTEEADRQP